MKFLKVPKNASQQLCPSAPCLAQRFGLGVDHCEAEAPLGRLASIVRSGVASVDEIYVRSALSTLEAQRQQEGLAVLEQNHVMHPRSGILITNLSRLPVQELEFDAGPPVAFEILTPAVRGAVALPSEDGVDIRVCYPLEKEGPPELL